MLTKKLHFGAEIKTGSGKKEKSGGGYLLINPPATNRSNIS